MNKTGLSIGLLLTITSILGGINIEVFANGKIYIVSILSSFLGVNMEANSALLIGIPLGILCIILAIKEPTEKEAKKK